MSAQNSKTRTWDFGKVDWEAYESHRPPYPKALYDLIFEYHKAHQGLLDAALDVGAGGGTVTKVLLEHFDHVVWSDASAGYVTQAEQRFSSEASAGRITFVQRKFDEFEPNNDLPKDHLVDLITAGTCIHFGDPAKLTYQFAPLLRSGGTLAAFSYGSQPIVSEDEPAREYIMTIKDKILRWFHDNITPLDKVDGTGGPQARYHNVDFDPELWKDVRRVTSLPNEHVYPAWIQTAESRVRPENERIEIVQDDFLTKEVDYAFFPEYFRNFAPGYDLADVIKDDLQKMKEALGTRKVLVKWPLLLILGTKR